jgi:glutamate synthase (NADPH/NADH) large chain
VLYGATSGNLYAAGQAGERFAVRNSGAHVVVEGCGSNGLEYMTGGIAVILGKTGSNFGAGMTGGMAFVIDPDGSFEANANPDSIVWQRLDSAYWEEQLKALIMAHAHATDSAWSRSIIEDWDRRRSEFWQICPKEMLTRLGQPLSDSEALEAAE